MRVAGQLWCPFQNCEHIIDNLGALWYKSAVPQLLGYMWFVPFVQLLCVPFVQLLCIPSPQGIHKNKSCTKGTNHIHPRKPWYNYYMSQGILLGPEISYCQSLGHLGISQDVPSSDNHLSQVQVVPRRPWDISGYPGMSQALTITCPKSK